jgi:hypothetical protein
MKAMWWSLPLAIAFSAMAYSISIYNIEAEKQASFMMKTCVDAGGEWLLYWNNLPYCKRMQAKATGSAPQ